MEEPRVSIVIPANREGDVITTVLDRLCESVTLPFEVLVVFDRRRRHDAPRRRATRRRALPGPSSISYGPGPAQAIRFGIDSARAPVIVVTMADGSDDPQQIDELVRLVERGVVVAAASRYMSGGQQIGGPP